MSPRHRLVCSILLAGGLVAGSLLQLQPAADQDARSGDALREQLAATAAEARTREGEAAPHRHGDVFMRAMQRGGESGHGGHDHDHDHDHSDATTKNALTRTTDSGPLTRDPTTAQEARAALASLARDRALPQPRLVPGLKPRPRAVVPQDRYAMAGGCYTMQAATGGYVHRSGTRPTAVGPGAEPFHFQATHVGRYLLYGTKADFLATSSLLDLVGHTPAFLAKPTAAGNWTVTEKSTGAGSGFTFTLQGGKGLVSSATGALTIGPAAAATPFRLRLATGCAAWPEIQTNVSRPFKGATPLQETRGYLDAHSHPMTHEFLGGRVLCGLPWHPFGVTHALVDCPDHTAIRGYGSLVEAFLSGRPPGHDTVGWPTFRYWPNPHSLTHQGLYYKWLERSWRGGLRVFTSLLTENNVMCELYPLKKNPCNDMRSIRIQARDMFALQDYIDAQYGGPGRGWYRIVTDPFQARRVVNQGKLAVVMGIETSVPFDCNVGTRLPKCTKASIDRAVDEMYRLGVRQMELTNKFDNGLTGVAGDEGATGAFTNSANFYNTGHFLRMQACPSSFAPGVQDKQQLAVPVPEIPDQDAIFGAIGKLFGNLSGAVPAYTTKPHCNQAGLTELGRHLLNRMIDKGMLFDPDHMSVIARRQALDLLEQAARRGRQPGVLSSHSWSTPDAYPRIYRLGGVITPYAGDSTGFLAKWRQHLKWRDPRYYFGIGYGADVNGFGTQGDPRNPSEANDVDYPFTGLGGVTVDRQRGGQRVWDINRDGVSHYGLYPDWIQDVRVLAGRAGAAFVSDMSRGAEAYLQTWERAVGITNDGCRDPRALRGLRAFRALRPGMSSTTVLRRVGQPHTRLGTSYGYCARDASGDKARVRVEFTTAGRVLAVRL